MPGLLRAKTSAILLLCLAALWCGAGLASAAGEDRKTRLVVWGIWRSEGWKALYQEFERRNPDIQLVLSTSGGRMDEQKLMCGIAGGSPPDVINQDRFSVGGWAARGAFLPLDDFIKRDRGRPDAVIPEDFYPACWNEAVYQGRVYAIPNTTDDRILYYNEDLLKREGLVDQQGRARPPRTWAELKDYARRLTKETGGRLTQLGFIPNYGNSWLYLYGWQNGGEFMSPDGRACTLDDPGIVEALTFITDVYDALGGAQKVEAFQTTFQSGELHPLLTGKVAMMIDTNGMLGAIAQYRPDMRFGVAPAPVPAGRPFITWSGGFSWAIPKGAKHVEEAWRFTRFMTSVEAALIESEAEYRYARSWGRIFAPGMFTNVRANEAVFARFAPKEPRFREAFAFALSMMPVSRFRPVTPVGQVLWDEHARAMDLAIRHALTPQEALRAGQRKVQEALDLVVKRKQYPLLNWSYPLAWAGGAAAVLLLVFAARLARDNRRRGRQGTKENWAGLTFAGPWLLGFVILTAGPVLASLVLSFCRYDVLHPIEYAGWDNYLNLIRVKVATAGSPWPWQWHWKAADPLFWKSLWNTIYMVAGVPLGMAVGLGVAMLLNANVRGLSTYRTIYYLPAIVPAVAASILWLWVLSPEYGLINSTLKSLFGLAGPQWLQSPKWSKPSIILMGLWSAGAGMIIWLAGLKGIPQQLYEAAEIDGAAAWARFRHITLPMLTPYVFFNLIMGVIGTFQIFTQAYIMTQGGPVDSTLFYVYYLFNNAFRYFAMGYAAAMAWILFWLILALTLIQLRLAPRWVHYEQ